MKNQKIEIAGQEFHCTRYTAAGDICGHSTACCGEEGCSGTEQYLGVSAQIDWENSAEEFWDSLRETAEGEAIEAAFDSSGEGILSVAQAEFCKKVKGFKSGPSHAPTAILFQRFGAESIESRERASVEVG